MLRAKVAKGGKITIPSAYRKQLNIKMGDEIILVCQDHKIIMTSLRAILEQSRQIVSRYLKPQTNHIDPTALNDLTETHHD